jgi:hypothetical protein
VRACVCDRSACRRLGECSIVYTHCNHNTDVFVEHGLLEKRPSTPRIDQIVMAGAEYQLATRYADGTERARVCVCVCCVVLCCVLCVLCACV